MNIEKKEKEAVKSIQKAAAAAVQEVLRQRPPHQNADTSIHGVAEQCVEASTACIVPHSTVNKMLINFLLLLTNKNVFFQLNGDGMAEIGAGGSSADTAACIVPQSTVNNMLIDFLLLLINKKNVLFQLNGNGVVEIGVGGPSADTAGCIVPQSTVNKMLINFPYYY